MIIPKKIRIGEHDYKIKKCLVVDWTNFNVVGQINYCNKEIRLRTNIKDERYVEDNFFHELAHGLIKELEYNYPAMVRFRNDEDFVQELGLRLRQTFLDLQKKQGQVRA